MHAHCVCHTHNDPTHVVAAQRFRIRRTQARVCALVQQEAEHALAAMEGSDHRQGPGLNLHLGHLLLPRGLVGMRVLLLLVLRGLLRIPH